jgi:hypothetical protein
MERQLSRLDLDPFDRLFVAIVQRAILDYQSDPSRTPRSDKDCDSEAARDFLRDLGLLNAAGEVTVTEQSVL